MTPQSLAPAAGRPLTAEDVEIIRDYWSAYADADWHLIPEAIRDDFDARLVAVGLAEWRAVTADDLDDAFAHDRGLEAGGSCLDLTALGYLAFKADADGWMPWSGGENPVPGQMVDWKARNGVSASCSSDDLHGWNHPHESGSRYDIIAFRLSRPASEQPVEAIGAGREEIARVIRDRTQIGGTDWQRNAGGADINAEELADLIAALSPASLARPELTVWYGKMPESNGRENWTALLRRVNPTDKWDQGFCFARSEYPGRVLYEADRVRWIIGERAERPDILAYDEDAHSGYVEPASPARTPMGGEVEALREALERIAYMRVELTGTPVDSEAANAWAITLDAAADIARQALAAASPSPAQGGIDYSTLADLHTIKGWLHGLSTHPDLEDVVADGGVTAGMVYQQEAREFAGRIGRIIAALSASPQPEAGEASEDDRAQAWLLRHYRQKAEQAGFGSLAEMMHAAAPPSVQPVEGK